MKSYAALLLTAPFLFQVGCASLTPKAQSPPTLQRALELNVKMTETPWLGQTQTIELEDITRKFSTDNLAGRAWRINEHTPNIQSVYSVAKDVSNDKILCEFFNEDYHLKDYGGPHRDITLLDLKSLTKTKITNTYGYDQECPVFSSDETKVAFKRRNVVDRKLRHHGDIIVVDLANKNELNVTNFVQRNNSQNDRHGDLSGITSIRHSRDLTFSPDGRLLAFSGYASHDSGFRPYSAQDIFLADLENKKLFNITNTDAVGELSPSFIDNKRLAFLSEDKQDKFMFYDLEEHKTYSALPLNFGYSAIEKNSIFWSSDGGRVAFTWSRLKDDRQVYRQTYEFDLKELTLTQLDRITHKENGSGAFSASIDLRTKAAGTEDKDHVCELYVDSPSYYGKNPIIKEKNCYWSRPIVSKDGKKIVLSSGEFGNQKNSTYVIEPWSSGPNR